MNNWHWTNHVLIETLLTSPLGCLWHVKHCSITSCMICGTNAFQTEQQLYVSCYVSEHVCVTVKLSQIRKIWNWNDYLSLPPASQGFPGSSTTAPVTDVNVSVTVASPGTHLKPRKHVKLSAVKSVRHTPWRETGLRAILSVNKSGFIPSFSH